MPLIGNKRALAFELIPVVPSWELRYAPERGAWAGLAIWADGKNICQYVIPGSSEIRDYLYIPLAPITDWMVNAFPFIEFEERAAIFPTTSRLHESAARWGDVPPPRGFDEDDWLEAREEWWSHHFLRSGADGARVPNLAFARDDEQLVITWRPPKFFSDDSPLMLAPEGDFSVPWSEGRSILNDYTAHVAEWLRQSRLTDIYTWATKERPLEASAPPLARSIELLTGRRLDALEALFQTQSLADLLALLKLSDTSGDPAASPECQILRDLSPALSTEVGEVLTEIGNDSLREEPEALATWRRWRDIALDAARPARSPEEAGQLAAIELRRTLQLNGQPITDSTALLSQLGLSYTHLSVVSQHDRMVVGLRDGGSLVARTLDTPRTRTLWGRRFESSRALGHLLLDPIRAGAIGAASSPFAQETRRRRSGAFAAELLLPETALAQASGHLLDGAAEDDVFQSLLERFGVGARAAAYQLWNRGWLSSTEVRDELIDRFESYASSE
jgi:hypothetical protein